MPRKRKLDLKQVCWLTADLLQRRRLNTGDEFDLWTAEVVRTFKDIADEHGKSVAGDVFMELDTRPGHYSASSREMGWHAGLRQVRNTPAAGHQLFAVWQ